MNQKYGWFDLFRQSRIYQGGCSGRFSVMKRTRIVYGRMNYLSKEVFQRNICDSLRGHPPS